MLDKKQIYQLKQEHKSQLKKGENLKKTWTFGVGAFANLEVSCINHLAWHGFKHKWVV
jgi:hypothetical protein